MSIKALNWAWSLEHNNQTELLVMLALADYADDNHQCFPSQAVIAKRSLCSVDTVQRAIKRLVKKGWISHEMRGQFSKKGRTSNLYTLHLEGVPENTSATATSGGDQGRKMRSKYISRKMRPTETADLNRKTAGFKPHMVAVTGTTTLRTTTLNNNINASAREVVEKSVAQVQAVEPVPPPPKQIDLDELQRVLLEAAGPCLDNPANCQGLLSLGIPLAWIAEGCDLALDIVPALRATAAKQSERGLRDCRSWKFFNSNVLRARASRIEPFATGTAAAPTPAATFRSAQSERAEKNARFREALERSRAKDVNSARSDAMQTA